MNEQITSAAELDALPVRSIGIDEDGDAWQKFDDGWRAAFCDPTAEPNPSEVPPLTVLYCPDQPQRVQPSREDVARALAAANDTLWDFAPNEPDDVYMRDARAVLALFAQQPTVAEVKAADDGMVTIPRPHVPFGPEGVPEEKADADYLRNAVRNIDFSVERGRALWGSNLTATIRKLLLDVADSIEREARP